MFAILIFVTFVKKFGFPSMRISGTIIAVICVLVLIAPVTGFIFPPHVSLFALVVLLIYLTIFVILIFTNESGVQKA